MTRSPPSRVSTAVDAEHDSVLVAAGNRWFNLAAVDGDSFAYLTTRPAGPGKVEFGAHAFGPHAPAVAEAMAEQVRIWNRDQRGGPGQNFAVWPMGTPEVCLPDGLVIDKRSRSPGRPQLPRTRPPSQTDQQVAQVVDGW